MRGTLKSVRWLLIALACLTASCDGQRAAQTEPPVPQDIVIGLQTSLPIMWSEEARIEDFLSPEAEPHWALDQLRAMGEVRALDSLAGEGDDRPLADIGLLMLAQPYPLTPDENVVLDEWVRAGGRVLLFADPMLTGESAYALGDRRRPQDIVMLSPILGHWGLRLEFDSEQPAGDREVPLERGSVPVNLPGRFAVSDDSGRCRLAGEGLLADCRIGNGRVLALADAAVLERDTGDSLDSRRQVMRRLLTDAAQ